MSRSVHVPAGIFDSRQYGFAPVTIVPTPFGSAVHRRGCLGRKQKIVGAGDIGRQLKSLENLAAALEPVGRETRPGRRAGLSSKATSPKARPSAALKAMFGDKPPCSTWIGVPAWPTMDLLVEVGPRRFSSRRRTASERLAPLTDLNEHVVVAVRPIAL